LIALLLESAEGPQHFSPFNLIFDAVGLGDGGFGVEFMDFVGVLGLELQFGGGGAFELCFESLDDVL
jgi:hypothetical protein